MLQLPSPAVMSPACGPEGASGQRLQLQQQGEGGTRKSVCAHLVPKHCSSQSFVRSLCMDTDFSSAFLAYQVYIHHPKCLFNPIRAVFSWGLDLSLMSA